MRLLRLAIESQRWDLAACTIVLAAATCVNSGERQEHGKERKQESKRKTARR